MTVELPASRRRNLFAEGCDEITTLVPTVPRGAAARMLIEHEQGGQRGDNPFRQRLATVIIRLCPTSPDMPRQVATPDIP